ncbi:MAG: hypothetical protein KDJ36_12070 [Hyphomicrobiaceae bacterium]|nr:hypothetical protein [Hyphomicrobiaceae bacterium]
MRYVLAMAGGLIGAALMARFVAVKLAPWAARQFTYDSPDGSASVEQWTFMAVLAGGLLVGWAAGWLVGSFVAPQRRRS